MDEKEYPYMYGQAHQGLRECLSDLQAIRRCLATNNYHGAETFIELGIRAASLPIKLNMASDTEVEQIVPIGEEDK